MPQNKPSIAYFSMEFALRSTIPNYAGGLVVMKRGTATVSARELATAVRSVDEGLATHPR